MIGLKCPKCQRMQKVDESQAGTVGSCPGCGVKLRIPQLKAPASPGTAPPSSPASRKTSPQSKPPAGRQTAIQAKAAKPSSDPSVRAAGAGSPAPPSEPMEEEEFEYTLDDIEEPEVPPPPKRRRPIEVEDEEDPEEEIEEEDETEDDEDEEEEDEEDEEEEDEQPQVRKKKKKKSEPGRLVVPILIGIGFLFVLGCTGGLYYLFTRKSPPPDPSKAMAIIEKFGGKVIREEKDPERPVIEVTLQGTDADNGALEALRAFPKLKKLNLSRCTKVDNPGMAWLEDLKELQVLNCSFCTHVSDGGMESIGKLTNLEELNLDQTQTTDLGLAKLKNLKKLKKLSLNGAMLATGLGLQGAIPGLEVIKN
jgi:hypothetical protein